MGDDNINVGMVTGAALGTGGAEAAAVADEIVIEGPRGGGYPRLGEVGEPDSLEKMEGEEDPEGPFPGAEGGEGGPQKKGEDGEEGAAESKPAEKGAQEEGALGAGLGPAAGPSGLDAMRAALAGSDDEETEAESVPGDDDEEGGAAERSVLAMAKKEARSELGATTGPNGFSLYDNAQRAALGGRRDEERKGKSARGIATDSHGLGGEARVKREDEEKPGAEAGADAERRASEDAKREAKSTEGDPQGNGVGVQAAALLAVGAALVVVGSAAAQRHFAAGEQLGAPAEGTLLVSVSPSLFAHHGRLVTECALPPPQSARHLLTGVQLPADPEATLQEPPHLGRGPWVEMPGPGTSTAIPGSVHGDGYNPDEVHRQDGLYSILASVLIVFLAAAAAALVLLQE